MKRVFLDTNVLLDVLLHRELFLRDSAQVVDRGFRGEIGLYATSLTFATCLFVARRSLGYANAVEAMRILERHICIVTMDAKRLHDALYAQAPDFEDMLQYNAAVAAGCEYIITRNEKHFPQESAHIMTPTQFLRDCPFEK